MAKKLLLLCCFITLVALSCVPNAVPGLDGEAIQGTSLPATDNWKNIGNETGSQCIPPESEWEFPIEPPRSWEAIVPSPVIPPPSEWEVQTSLPEDNSESTLALIEHQPGYDVIWVVSGDKLFRFRTDTKQWSSVSLRNDFELSGLESLFQNQDGQVWAFGYFLSQSVYFARFLRLNENGQFEFADGGGIQSTPLHMNGQTPLVSSSGVFWILLNDDSKKIALYSFDPNVRIAKRQLEGEKDELGWSLAMGQDERIFLVKPKEGGILRYDPDTKAVDNLEVYYRFEGNLTDFFFPYLFVDRSGNLWIGDYVWVDLKNLTVENSPTWHQIIRSPVFISKNKNLRQTYLWTRPRPMLESSDGRIWFHGGSAGLVWLDPQKGVWCKFTTIDSEILEDQDGNLWLLYDSNLYKYSITP